MLCLWNKFTENIVNVLWFKSTNNRKCSGPHFTAFEHASRTGGQMNHAAVTFQILTFLRFSAVSYYRTFSPSLSEKQFDIKLAQKSELTSSPSQIGGGGVEKVSANSRKEDAILSWSHLPARDICARNPVLENVSMRVFWFFSNKFHQTCSFELSNICLYTKRRHANNNCQVMWSSLTYWCIRHTGLVA